MDEYDSAMNYPDDYNPGDYDNDHDDGSDNYNGSEMD